MSNQHVSWALQQKLTPSRKLVLLKLSNMADVKGVCWPSVANIARDCCLSTRSVQRVLRELESKEFIRVFVRHRSDGSRTSNGYVVAPGEGVILSPPGATHDTTRGQQHCRGVGDTGVTPLNHKIISKEPPPLPVAGTTSVASNGGSGDASEMVYPPTLSAVEVVAANHPLRGIVPATAQQVLDELAGNIERNAIRGSPIAYLRGLVKRVHARTFTPECGLAILKRRQAQCRARKAKALARERVLEYPVDMNDRNVRRILDLKEKVKDFK